MACVSRYFSAQNHLFAMADVENLYRNQILPQNYYLNLLRRGNFCIIIEQQSGQRSSIPTTEKTGRLEKLKTKQGKQN